jgi:hypothetical protein
MFGSILKPKKKERARKEGETWLSPEEERYSFRIHHNT